MWHLGGGWSCFLPFGGGWGVLLWVVVVGLVVWGIVWFGRRDGHGRKVDSLGIAGERYARGEITREEYERIKKDLS